MHFKELEDPLPATRSCLLDLPAPVWAEIKTDIHHFHAELFYRASSITGSDRKMETVASSSLSSCLYPPWKQIEEWNPPGTSRVGALHRRSSPASPAPVRGRAEIQITSFAFQIRADEICSEVRGLILSFWLSLWCPTSIRTASCCGYDMRPTRNWDERASCQMLHR